MIGRLSIILVLIAASGLVKPQSARAGLNDLCDRALRDEKLELSYDPEQALAKYGTRTDLIRLGTDMPSEGEAFGWKKFTVNISFNDAIVGELIAGRLRRHPEFVEVAIERILDPNFKGRGLGTFLYLTYAKLLWERHQLRLTPGDERSADGRALIESFYAKGWIARDPETGLEYIRPEVLSGPGSEKLARFMEKAGIIPNR